MTQRNDLESLKSYLAAISPESSLEALADDREAPMRMASAPGTEPSESEKAQVALQKLALGRELEREDQFLVEAIILPDRRPAIDVIDGAFTVEHPLWTHLNEEGAARRNILQAIPSVGRIELPDSEDLPYAGTGFAVGETLLMTNRHVAETFASGLGDRHLTFIPGQSAALDFKREKDGPPPEPLTVTGVRMIHPWWDMALIEVETLPDGVSPLRLSLDDPDALSNREIAVIGYPGFDARNPTDVQQKVFDGLYYVKRLQPGKLTGRKMRRSYGNRVNAATHDASTLGGNSGSCVVDLTTGSVVALHFAGRYLKTNYAVPSCELARDPRVASLCLNFVDPVTGEDPNPWAEQWDAIPEREAPDAAPRDAAAVVPIRAQGGAGSVSLTVPLTITVSLGQQGSAPAISAAVPAPVAASPVDADATERLLMPTIDPNYALRPGYDPMFLGTPAPMPKARNADDLSTLDDGGTELKYHHFSTVMNRSRRLAQITAANIDASPARKKPDPSKSYAKWALSGFESDRDEPRWFADPRIPALHQLPEKFFTRDRQAFDKGHVARRAAISWGDSYEEVQFANGDSYHSTNCSPQVKGFNQSSRGGQWGKLENLVLEQAKSERLCVFAGPVFADTDPVFAGIDEDGPISVRIPRAYWKVIVAVKDGTLQSFGYLLKQDLADVDFEFQVSGVWRERLVALDELERENPDVAFDDLLHAGDMARRIGDGEDGETPFVRTDDRIRSDGPI